MGILQAFSDLFYPQNREQRSVPVSAGFPATFSLTDPTFGNLFNLNSGPVTVSEETALSIATVYRCVDVLSSTFAAMPWDLFRFENDKTDVATGHPVRPLLSRPHPLQTSYIWRKTLLTAALLWGNGYARIIRNGVGRPTAFKLYLSREVMVLTDQYRNVAYYRFPDVATDVESDDVIHLKIFTTDGVYGRSVIRQAAENFRGSLQSRRFITSVLANGARPAGIITKPGKINNKQNLKDMWGDSYSGDNVGKTAVLDEGMDYKQISMNPVDVQLLEVMKLTDEQICALFGVPQHMAGILRQSTNNNIEHQGLEFLSYSLKPHVENFTQEFNYKALLSQEQGRVVSQFDTDSLQLADLKTKQQWYQFMRNTGIMSANEIRDELNLNPYVGGDTKFIQGAMVPIGEDGKPIYPASKPPMNTPTDTPKRSAHTNGHHLNGHALPN